MLCPQWAGDKQPTKVGNNCLFFYYYTPLQWAFEQVPAKAGNNCLFRWVVINSRLKSGITVYLILYPTLVGCRYYLIILSISQFKLLTLQIISLIPSLLYSSAFSL